ncbi:hypothetical protein MKX01_034090 [Papaver californicum]|nr:hypothetical protein MKX01_034090 [Papaver californicum]
MGFTYLQSFSLSVYPVIFGVFLCFLTLGLYFKLTSQAVDYRIFLGSIPSLLLNYDQLTERMTEVFSSLGTGRGSFYMDGPMLSGSRFLVTCHPENIEYILKTNFENFPKGESFREVFSILGVGILNLDSDKWRLQRKLAHAELILGEFKTLVAETSRKMVEEQLIPLLAHVAEEGCNIDLQDVFSRFAFDMNMSLVSIVSLQMSWLRRLLRIGKERALIKAQKKVDENYGEFIVQKRKDLLAGVKTDDFLSLYIKALADETSIFSSLARKDNFLRDEMFNFFVAGRDTTKSAHTWLFWLVSITPLVEAKILEELNTALFSKKKKKGKETKSSHTWPWVFDSDGLKGLVYLHAALSESLRKTYFLTEVWWLLDWRYIILSFYSLGRIPWIWGEDCLEFKPERWIDENGKLIVMKSVVAAVLFNFHVKVVEGHHVCPKQTFSLSMKHGLQVNIKN